MATRADFYSSIGAEVYSMTVTPHNNFSHLLLALDLQELKKCFPR
jgi:hypothetical protein